MREIILTSTRQTHFRREYGFYTANCPRYICMQVALEIEYLFISHSKFTTLLLANFKKTIVETMHWYFSMGFDIVHNTIFNGIFSMFHVSLLFMVLFCCHLAQICTDH